MTIPEIKSGKGVEFLPKMIQDDSRPQCGPGSYQTQDTWRTNKSGLITHNPVWIMCETEIGVSNTVAFIIGLAALWFIDNC